MPVPVRSGLTPVNSQDPLSVLLLPSPTETPEERMKRLEAEQDAKHVSDRIDEELNKERKGTKPVKILLLGQSESGKSTTLKNFQLMHEPKAFNKERALWRAVIQLNVVRSFHLILDAMQQALEYVPGQRGGADDLQDLPKLTTQHMKMKLRLSPLLELENVLMNRLSPVRFIGSEPTALLERSDSAILSSREVAVNSTMQWKECIGRFMKCERVEGEQLYPGNEATTNWNDLDDPGRVLNACFEDMVQLWNDPVIQGLLASLRIRLQDHAGFFLDSLERVTQVQFLPTDEDILRARLKTLGVTEHKFKVNTGKGTGMGRDWRIYDVGGHRSQRAAWVPYFDDMDAIIFLAPISAFDQKLEEDRKLNRLFDSFQLWTYVVSNELLSHTNVVLFLNKFDIFKKKIGTGICFADYVTSYKDKPNDVQSTSSYIRKKFSGLMKSHSKLPRIFYGHFTTVTDTKSTKYILSNLQDMLMRQNLADCNLT